MRIQYYIIKKQLMRKTVEVYNNLGSVHRKWKFLNYDKI